VRRAGGGLLAGRSGMTEAIQGLIRAAADPGLDPVSSRRSGAGGDLGLDRGQTGGRSEEAEAGVDLGGGDLGGRSRNERDKAWRQMMAGTGEQRGHRPEREPAVAGASWQHW
jgi:hypothetical protein